jgi:hypothetical protein
MIFEAVSLGPAAFFVRLRRILSCLAAARFGHEEHEEDTKCTKIFYKSILYAKRPYEVCQTLDM